MEKYLVIWQRKAQRAFDNQMFWYYLNANKQFAATFFRNITETVSRISKMPSIGQLEKEDEKRIYRPARASSQSLLEHLHLFAPLAFPRTIY